MELTSPHLTRPSPAFALVSAAFVFVSFFFLPAALPPHVDPVHTSPHKQSSQPVLPAEELSPVSQSFACSLNWLFTLHFFFCRVPSRAQGNHRLSCATYGGHQEKHLTLWEKKMCCTRFNCTAAYRWRATFRVACENVLSSHTPQSLLTNGP